MATFINLPHEVQDLISNYFRKTDPFSKVPNVATIKALHPNLNKVPLWKNLVWEEHILQWRDENLTKLRWKYQYGTLPNKMIEKGWENKINKQYWSQNCFVKTMVGTTLGTGFVKVPKEYKVIWFEVSLLDLITGVRPLPSCFGRDGNDDWRVDGGTLQFEAATPDNWIPAPTLETLIPRNKRREWLIECFMECVLVHWGEKIVEKKRGEKPNFIKEFKNMMDLPSGYELSQTYLFRMFLRKLQVRGEAVHEKEGYLKRSQNIDDLCRHNINVLK